MLLGCEPGDLPPPVSMERLGARTGEPCLNLSLPPVHSGSPRSRHKKAFAGPRFGAHSRRERPLSPRVIGILGRAENPRCRFDTRAGPIFEDAP
jgi:hypothetical protein